MQAKAGVALLCLLLVSVAQGQMYCDPNRYQPAARSCCTPLTVINVFGGCCFLPDSSECRCDPAVYACGQATAAPTPAPTPPPTPAPTAAPTAAPTSARTLPPAGLCPAVPTRRLLNAPQVTNVCAHNGVIGLYTTVAGMKRQFCNAVIVYNSYTNRREIVMSMDCRIGINQVLQNGLQLFAESQDVSFPFSLCNIEYEYSTAEKSVMIPNLILEGYLNSLVAECDNTACGFNVVVMGSEVRPDSNCYLLSYGATGVNVVSPGDYISNGLRRARVVTTRYQDCGWTSFRNDEVCVKLEDYAAICQGDTSAALFCPLTTGEEVFLGYVSTTTACDGAIPSYAPVKIHYISATSQA